MSFDDDNRDDPRRALVDQLVALAEDHENAWAARLYLSAALWLEAERHADRDDDPSLTIAAERVKRKAGAPPEHFRSFIRAWLDPEQVPSGGWGSAPWGELEWTDGEERSR